MYPFLHIKSILYWMLLCSLSLAQSNFNVEEGALPSSITTAAKNVAVEVGKVTVQGIPVTYRRAIRPAAVASSGQSLLLLHGNAFNSETWVKRVTTLQHLAAMGHDAVAIDLPGFGRTPSARVSNITGFLVEVMEKLDLKKPVVVAPSMSGGWALPLITERPDAVGGFIPVAPVGTYRYAHLLRNLDQLYTMIVYGEFDRGAASSTRDLQNIPNHVVVELPKSNHPAYLDAKAKWHKILYNFMRILKTVS